MLVPQSRHPQDEARAPLLPLGLGSTAVDASPRPASALAPPQVQTPVRWCEAGWPLTPVGELPKTNSQSRWSLIPAQV